MSAQKQAALIGILRTFVKLAVGIDSLDDRQRTRYT